MTSLRDHYLAILLRLSLLRRERRDTEQPAALLDAAFRGAMREYFRALRDEKIEAPQ